MSAVKSMVLCDNLIKLCFHVDVDCVVVCYTICGAIAFQALETTDETDDLIEKVVDDKKAVTDNLNTR